MEPGEYETIERVEDTHWWYRGMAVISMALLEPAARVNNQLGEGNLHILDAGCGPGGMFKHLAHLGAPIGIDFHPLAVQYAKRHAPIARASIEDLPFATASFDIITSFDVMCHESIKSDQQVLNEFARLLRPNGILLLRLPAFEALRGAHDRYVHTRRRYTAADLSTKLQNAGFTIRRLTYANFLLSPLIILRRRLQSDRTAASDVTLPSPLVNSFLETVLRLERQLIPAISLPFGVSLFALAIKPGSTHAA